jgi:hypothetical protein
VRSNPQTITIFEEVRNPVLTELIVRKKAGKIIRQLAVGMKAKKLRLFATGADFESGAQLLVSGAAVQLLSSSPTELVGMFTQDMLAAPAQLTVQVRNPSGRVSNAITLTVAPQ